MKLFLLFLILFSDKLWADTVSQSGAISFLSLNKGLSPNFDLNFYHSDTFTLSEEEFKGKKYPSRFAQTYFQTSVGYKFLPQLNFSLGHIYQKNNPVDDNYVNENRIFGQVVYLQTFDAHLITHRTRFEERFIDEQDKYENKTRLRYQIGFSIPFDGRQLDPGEWYFNGYNEFYFSTTGERYAFFSDDWIYAGCGYQTLEWGKLELGPLAQYSVINKNKDIRALYSLQFGWILKFK